MLNLYLITYENDDGEDLNVVVQAKSVEQAFAQARTYWVSQGWIEDDQFLGDIILKSPTSDMDVAWLFMINPKPNQTGVLGWHSKEAGGTCFLAGYVSP